MRTMHVDVGMTDVVPAVAPAEPTVRRRTLTGMAIALAPLIGITVFLAGWQLATKVFHIEKFVLPTPTSILSHINSDKSFYLRNARTTLWEAALGFGLAFVVAMVVASVIAHSRFLERAVMPLVVLVQVTPLIAYAPAVVIWLGFGLTSILTMTALICFVPFVVNTVTGLRSVDPDLVELARSVDASRWEVYVRLRLPSAVPHIFAAARIAVGLALIGAVLGEFFGGSTRGLGHAVKQAQASFLTLQLWGSVYVLAMIGAVAILLLGGVERLATRWQPTHR